MAALLRSRASGALLRAGAVALLVALPQLLLGHGAGGTPLLVTLLALMAGLFVLSEYAARAPSLLEFRDARPYNRLRLGSAALAVILACVLLRPDWSGEALALPARAVGAVAAALAGGLAWSPVHLLVSTLPEGASAPLREAVFAAAATAYGLSLLMVVGFALLVRLRGWPARARFNVWVNLPQFDPTSGGDVVERLQQNAVVNLALGILLPIIAPMVADLLALPFEGAALANPAALVWVVILWAFLPASLAMRGLALHRIGALIAAHRARLRGEEGAAQAA